jgi:hypothetical protein
VEVLAVPLASLQIPVAAADLAQVMHEAVEGRVREKPQQCVIEAIPGDPVRVPDPQVEFVVRV